MNLILTLLFAFAPFQEDTDWVPIEKTEVVTPEEIWESQDHSIWPIFSKKTGHEKILIRFPSDPVYRYLSPNEMEITAIEGSETTQLLILEKGVVDSVNQRIQELTDAPNVLLLDVQKESDRLLDIQFFTEGKWVFERVLITEEHLYIFQSSSTEPHIKNHARFVASFDLENL